MKRSREELEELSYKLKQTSEHIPVEIAPFKEVIAVSIQDINNYLETGYFHPNFEKTIAFVTEVCCFLSKQRDAVITRRQLGLFAEHFNRLQIDKLPSVCKTP